MANGDIYILCPVLPLRAQLQLSYIKRLKAYVDDNDTLEAQTWVENLAKQVPQVEERTSSPPRSLLSRSLAKTKKEVEEVDRPILVHPPHLSPSGGPATGIHAPLERQGPIIFDPAPEEGEDEEAATDMVLLSVPASTAGQEGSESAQGRANAEHLRVLSVVWGNGRVDVGLDVEGTKGRWFGQVRLTD